VSRYADRDLAPQGTRVTSLHVGYMDTDLARHVTEPKSDPPDIARIALDGIEAGEAEIIADEISKQVLAGLGRSPGPLPAGRLTAPPPAGRDPPASIWMYQGGFRLLYPVSGGRAPEAAGRRGGGST
jgi:hypothetical protein